MNSLTIFTLIAVFVCFTANSCAKPLTNMELPVEAAESANTKDGSVISLSLTDVGILNQSEESDGDDSSNVELKRTARGLGLGFGSKFGGGGFGHSLKGFGGGFGGLGGGFHGLGGGLGLLKFKPFFNKG